MATVARLAYDAVGSGVRDVLMIHGFMVSGAVFEDVVTPLANGGRRIVVPDLCGVGTSDRPPSGYSIEDHAERLWELADDLELERPDLIGHSMGGQIAQWMAAARPRALSKLVLINPVPADGLELPEDVRELFRSCAGDEEKLSMIFELSAPRLDPGVKRRLVADALGTSRASVEQGFDAWTRGGFVERLERIRAETHVIATSDPFLSPGFLQTRVVDRIAGARLHVLEGPGHYPQLEAPAATVKLLDRILSA